MTPKSEPKKKLSLFQSFILLLLIVFSVAVCIRLKTGGPMIGLSSCRQSC